MPFTQEERKEAEQIRRELNNTINSNPQPREKLERLGQVWNTEELSRDFEVHGFMAPLVVVTRKSDGKKGSLMFQHGPPRLYFFWEEHKDD